MDADNSAMSATDKLFANPNRLSQQKKARSAHKLPIPKNNLAVPPLESVNDKLCQLSYSPATQTTVVTTTTTTTTAFPPFLIKAPPNLAQRDSKNYPLASKPTPDALKRFTFDLGGQIACFEEAVEVDPAMKEYNEIRSKLASSQGSSTSYRNSEATRSAMLSHFIKTASERSKKRSAVDNTPDSLQEGTEFTRPVKKARVSKAPSRTNRARSPVTPHSQRMRRERTLGRFADDDGQEPSQETPVSLLSQSASFPHGAYASNLTGINTLFEPASSSTSQTLGTPSPDTIAGPPSPPSFLEAPAMVATPPVADQDMDPSSSFAAVDHDTPSLDTSTHTILDASLPSPLLSPVTTGSPALTITDDEHEQVESSLDLIHLPDQKSLDHISSPAYDTSDASPLQISSMVDAFDSYPAELQQYLMYQFLRRCSKSLLQFTADIVNPALKCDFLSRLPTELSLNVIRYLDAKSLCRAAQVSKRWRELVDTDESVWRDLIRDDGFFLPKGEVDRAVREGWKWQGLAPSELDLGTRLPSRSPSPSALPTPQETRMFSATPLGRPLGRVLKRKASFQEETSKRRKTSHALGESSAWVPGNFQSRRSSKAFDADISAAEIPELGLKNLRLPHLYKSIYRRHHGFRKSWMDRSTEPHHLAFRAHGRHVVTCLQFDDDKILTGSDDTKIHVYNTNTGALVKQLDGHDGGVWALQYDGNTLVSGSTDRTVRVWDIEKGRCRHVFQGHTSTVRCLVILKPTVVGHNEDGSPIMMPKEPLIITGSRDSTLRIWSLPKPADPPFNPLGHSMTTDEQNPYFIRALQGHIHSVRAIAAHGDTLVSGSYDSTVRVWRISTGEVMHRLNGHAQKVYSVILDHKRNRCISGSMDNLVKVWSLETGQCIFNLEGHSSLVGLLDLNNGRLVSAAADWTLRVWDPETGHCRNILEAHTGAITCFQHDSQKVVSGSDRTLKMWDVQTGECVRDLLTDLSGGWQVKFNDRKCVAAVQRHNRTYIEVLDFGAARDGVPEEKLGTRILVDAYGNEIEDVSDDDDLEE